MGGVMLILSQGWFFQIISICPHNFHQYCLISQIEAYLLSKKLLNPLFGHNENHKERQVHYEDETDETFGDRDIFYLISYGLIWNHMDSYGLILSIWNKLYDMIH